MDESSNAPALRVFLWTIPRSLGTVFTKCMSFMEGVQIVKEPVSAAHVVGPECTASKDDDLQKMFNESVTNLQPGDDFGLIYDDDLATFKWVKDMLESPFPDKSFVFVHDQAYCLGSNYDNLPRGYTHTFLIRNPYKLFPSWKKFLVSEFPSFADKPFAEFPRYQAPAKFGYGELYELMVHVQETLGQKPIIIDADDLQTNPLSVLRQYCHLLDVEFKESMLQWETGNKMVHTWIISRKYQQGNKMLERGYYEDAFKSQEFNPPKELPSREEIGPDLLPLIDQCMPIYEKMYSMRIVPQ